MANKLFDKIMGKEPEEMKKLILDDESRETEEKISVKEQPIKEQLIEEQPIKEQLIEEQPVKEQLVEEQLVKEQQVEEQPIKEKLETQSGETFRGKNAFLEKRVNRWIADLDQKVRQYIFREEEQVKTEDHRERNLNIDQADGKKEADRIDTIETTDEEKADRTDVMKAADKKEADKIGKTKEVCSYDQERSAVSTKIFVSGKDSVKEKPEYNSSLGFHNKMRDWKEPEPEFFDFKKKKSVESEKQEVPLTSVILVDLVLDNTISMSVYYKSLYQKLVSLLSDISQEINSLRSAFEVRFGITYIRPDMAVEEESFPRDGFTEELSEVLMRLRTIRFSGGGLDGRENINGAVLHSLRKLHHASEEKATCVMILFSDSMPNDRNVIGQDGFDSMSPDFYEECSLAAASFYLNDDIDYLPDLDVGNNEAEKIGGELSGFKVKTLEKFLNSAEEEIAELVHAIGMQNTVADH